MQPSTAAEKRTIPTSTEALHSEAVQRVILAVRAQLDQPFSLQSLSAMAHSSRFHFNRTFRRVTGIPPFQFLYALRLELAKQLLLTTDASVVDICYEVGYNSLGTFTRRFTDLIGLSPTRLRSMAQMPLDRMLRNVERQPKYDPGECLTGQLAATPDFNGLIFVGLFETPIPQSKPVACTIVSHTGPYSIRHVPEGEFHLFALGLPWSTDLNAYFHYASALRGGGQRVSVSAGMVRGRTEVKLRAPAVTDPPILLTVPWLLRRFGTDAAAKSTDSPEIVKVAAAYLVGARRPESVKPVL
jgi:AraC family transcriptional regulator